MKSGVSVLCVLIVVLGLATADPTSPEYEDKEAIRADIIRKILYMRETSNMEEMHMYMKELESVMEEDLPKNLIERQSLLKSMYQELLEGEGQDQIDLSEGRGRYFDRFDSDEKEPYSA